MEDLKINTGTLKGDMTVCLELDDDREECEVKFESNNYLMYGQELKHKLRVSVTQNLHTKDYNFSIYNRGNTRLDLTDKIKNEISKEVISAWDQRCLMEMDFIKKEKIKYYQEKISENETEINSLQRNIDDNEADNRKYRRKIDDLECGV